MVFLSSSASFTSSTVKVDLARKAYLAGSRSSSSASAAAVSVDGARGSVPTLEVVAGAGQQLVEDVVAALASLLARHAGLFKQVCAASVTAL